MNLKSNIARTACLATAVLVLVAAPGYAHGGFDHVMGSVVKVANSVLTVKTTKGNVDVRLDGKTEITRNGTKASLVDLKPGTRVVIELPQGKKERVAQSVRIGAASKAVPQHAHSKHFG